jgi:aminoglycoside phosphotransferase family enzyme
MLLDIKQLLKPSCFDHDVDAIELIETHISWVILTGRYAYKIKKPVDFGFLNFSTLDRRKRYCEQEVELNRRLAPMIYLDVVPITETEAGLSMAGEAGVIEYAVRMKQFPQSAQLDNMLQDGRLSPGHMDEIALMLADFHRAIERADRSVDFGTPEAVYDPVEENFEQVRQHLDTDDYDHRLAKLAAQVAERFTDLHDVIGQRKQHGFVRQCHGDMHLGNMLWLDSSDFHGPVAFDCIEFNDNLSWIDVISELAFLVMDLQSRNEYGLANRCLNRYLEATGDYAGLRLLSFYQCYGAMVRAKVSVLRLEQENEQQENDQQERRQALASFESYLALAESYSRQTKPTLILMHGLSASGKSSVSQQLIDDLSVIRIRSDVERKRIHDVATQDHSNDDIDQGLYSPQASQMTYSRLLDLSESVLVSGMSVVVDAAFLKYDQRLPFEQLAQRLSLPLIILDVSATHDELRRRIVARKGDVSDANLAVLENQISSSQPLRDDEHAFVYSIDSQSGKAALAQLYQRLSALALA